MTVSAFLGCALTAYGPALALFIFTIARDPVRIIIFILSAFFWLLSLLLSAILWVAVVPLKEQLAFGLVFSIAFQESFRVLIFLVFRKANVVLKKITENEDTQIFDNRHILSYVVGLGFGVMSGAFSLVNVLADSLGPGTVGLKKDASPSFFMISAALGLALILLHTAWGVIAFDALEKKKWAHLTFVWLSHYLVSCLTLLNVHQYYAASLVPAYAALCAAAVLAFRAAGGSAAGIKAGLARALRTPATTAVTGQ